MTAFDPLIQQLIFLAEKAGKLIKNFYGQEHETGFLLEYKKDGSPLTRADQEADVLIQQGLQGLTPQIPIISEEQAVQPSVQEAEHFWLVDPLDGTKGFVERSGEFVVNIALIQNKQPILGLIHVPLTAETYIAFKKKAYVVKEGHAELLPPLQLPPKEWDVVIGHGLGAADEAAFTMRQCFPIRHIFQIGSALKFCLFARGKAHFSWRLIPCYEWDTAAAQALIEALGGCFITGQGRPLSYGKPDYLNAEGFFVYASKNYPQPSSFF